MAGVNAGKNRRSNENDKKGHRKGKGIKLPYIHMYCS